MNNEASYVSKSVDKTLLRSAKKRMYKSLTTPTLSFLQKWQPVLMRKRPDGRTHTEENRSTQKDAALRFG